MSSVWRAGRATPVPPREQVAADAGYVGGDSFKYQLNDGIANSNVATVTLHPGSEAGGENVPPVSQDDTFAVDAEGTLIIEAPGLLGNDSDADSDVLTALLASGPTQGMLTLQDDGSFSYTPATDFVGTDTFTYTASDGKMSGNLATVTIVVQNPNENHNPVAEDDGYVATAETLLSVSASEGVLRTTPTTMAIRSPRPSSTDRLTAR